MAKTVSIDKIVIQISGKDIELTLDEAKQLRDILDDTFGRKASGLDDFMDAYRKMPKKEYVPVPCPYPVYPYPYPRPVRPYWDRWKVTCETKAPRAGGASQQFGTLMMKAAR